MIHNVHGAIPLTRLLQNPHHLLGTLFKNLLLVKEKFLCKRGADKSSHAHCVLGFLCREDVVGALARADHAAEIGVFVPG